MRLTDLEPRWILGNSVFAFLCPHCKEHLLTCKNIVMSYQEQHELFEKEFGENWNTFVVPMSEAQCWAITGSVPNNPNAAFIEDLTVTPSIDASTSGHWHGHITKGVIE